MKKWCQIVGDEMSANTKTKTRLVVDLKSPEEVESEQRPDAPADLGVPAGAGGRGGRGGRGSGYGALSPASQDPAALRSADGHRQAHLPEVRLLHQRVCIGFKFLVASHN